MKNSPLAGQAQALEQTNNLILPGDPLFNLTLNSRPPGWKQIADRLSGEFAFIVRPGVGLWEPVSNREVDEYLYGGEYSDRLEEIDEVEETEEEWEEWEVELSELDDFYRRLSAAIPQT